MDADGVTLACATAAELRAARRARVRSALVGLGAANGVPEGPLVSFGIAGALRPGLEIGTVIDAIRVVDEQGAVLWEGPPLGIASARPGTILGASRIIDHPDERARLQRTSGADAVDMESGPLARAGKLAGCIRAISDTPDRGLAGLAKGAKLNGDVNYPGLLSGFLRSPLKTARAARDARVALKRLEALA